MILTRDGRSEFALGMYELPRDESEWRRWSESGINLVQCKSRDELDLAHDYGMLAWVAVPMVVTDDDGEAALRSTVEALRDHPSLAVWEAPDESIWRTVFFGQERARRLWREPEDRVAEVLRRRAELLAGLARGSAIIRDLDPGRKLWLNEAMGCDFDTLTRCLPYLDVVGGDFYAVPSSERRSLNLWGPMLDRFHRVAPRHELWSVQQAFSWSTLVEGDGGEPTYPTREEARFTAWQVMMHSATGVIWWGSAYEDRPAPFLDGIMEVASELSGLHPFLTTETRRSVSIRIEEQVQPRILGVSGGVYDADDQPMLALGCEAPRGHEILLSGFDGDPNEMTQVVPASEPFVRLRDGWATKLQGYEVRVYVSDGHARMA